MATVAYPFTQARPRTAADGGNPAARTLVLDTNSLHAIVPEWGDLASRAVEPNPFFEPDFLLPALRHLSRRGRVRVAAARSQSGQLIALAPVLDRRIGRIEPARFVWTHDYGPLGVPLLDGAAPEAAATALLGALSPMGAAVAFPFLTLDGPSAAALTAVATSAGRSVDIVDEHLRAATSGGRNGAADSRQALPTRRRKEFARQMRRLAELGDVRIDTVLDANSVQRGFEAFLRLEQSGWKGQSGTALAATPETAAFSNEVMSGAVGRRISSIRLDGRPVAMVVSFVSGSAGFTWKIAHDPEFDRFSPGAQLMLEAGRMLAEEGAVRVDSLAAPDHPMIDHLWAGRLRVGTLVVGPSRSSSLHRIGLAAMAGELSLRKRVRRVLRRLDR